MNRALQVAALRQESEHWQPLSIRHFSIPSKWLFGEDSRLDATTYAQDGCESFRVLDASGYKTVPLGTLVRRVYHPTENQPRSNFKRIWVGPEDGPAFLTGRQLFFFRPDREKFVSRKMPKLAELQVPQGTILLSRSGTTGYPVLVGKWLAHFVVTDDAIRIFAGEAPVGFIYAYLASSIGRPLMVKSEYGATVSHLEAKHISSLPVPRLGDKDEKRIHEKISKAYALRDQANELLDGVEEALHRALGVKPFLETDIEYLGDSDDPRAFTTSSSELEDRLDSTHHVPVVRSVIHKLEKGRYKLIDLKQRVRRVYVAPRFARVYVEPAYGTPLLQGSQMPLIHTRALKYISKTKTERIERWLLESGWVLVTCSGTIGRVAVATRRQNGWAASQHILRIMPKDRVSHAGFLAAYLSTPFGQHQLKAKIYGGVVDELTAEDTEKIFMPDVPFGTQKKIGEPVLRAFEMRDEASVLEDEAISHLERLLQKT